MTPRRAVYLIARREVSARLRARSFAVGTAVALVLLVGFVLVRSTLFDDDHRRTVGLNGQAISVAAQLSDAARQMGMDVRTAEVTSLAAGREQVASGQLDALVSGAPAALTVLVDRNLDDELLGVLNGLVRQQVLRGQLAAVEDSDPEGLDVDDVLRTVADAHVAVRALDAGDPGHDQRLAIALVLMALLFLSILLYGSMVAHGVVEERSGRIVETLLATVRPWQVLSGKVLGLGFAGLVQVTVVGAVGLVVALVAGVVTTPGAAIGALAWGIVWYLLGYLLYATVFAAFGARVSDAEDVRTALTPVTVVLSVALVFGFAVLSRDPAGTIATVLSLLPPLSPILMPGRIALDAVPLWQVAVAVVLTAATTVATTRLCGTIYRNSLLKP
jgi:ABC-2 type transport system permease protein